VNIRALAVALAAGKDPAVELEKVLASPEIVELKQKLKEQNALQERVGPEEK
jgi:hypothetical protein